MRTNGEHYPTRDELERADQLLREAVGLLTELRRVAYPWHPVPDYAGWDMRNGFDGALKRAGDELGHARRLLDKITAAQAVAS